MNKLLTALFLIGCANSSALTFNEALQSLHSHESIESIEFKAKATDQEAQLRGSWGDPKFKIAAKNFPKSSLKKDETPMTGVEFGLSQKISITPKYSRVEEAFHSLGTAYHYEASDKKELLTKAFWEILILRRKISEELSILNENNVWLSKILKVSKRLYSTGKNSQQALLDIQIRKSEVESEISNKKYDLAQIDDRLMYLIGSSDIESNSIPWQVLSKSAKKTIDYKQLSFEEKLKSKELSLSAAKLNYIPDVSVSFGYTKRSNIDDQGDFVAAAINFSIPLSSEKYSKHDKAIKEKFMATRSYENYKREKRRDISVVKKRLKNLIVN